MRFRTSKAKKLGWRFWINRDDYRSPELTSEIYLLGSNISSTSGMCLSLNADCEGTISFHIGIRKLFAFYLTLDAAFGYSDWWRRLLRLDNAHKYEGRDFEIRWYHNVDGCMSGPDLTIKLGAYPNGWSSKDPWWYSITCYPEKWLFGDYKTEEAVINVTTHPVTIKAGRDYPAAEYTLTCKEFTTTWRWKRLRKPFVMTRFEVSVNDPRGIPHPGKGTADYNCDESALYSQTSPAKNAEEAVDKFVEQVYWYRKNYPL